MESSSNVFNLFGPKQDRIGQMPTRHDVAIELQKRHVQLVFTAMFAESWSFQHRQLVPGRHRTRLGKYGAAVLAARPAINPKDRFMVTVGWNFKLRSGDGELIQYHPTDGYKLCADPEPVLEALHWGCDVRAFYLFSDNMQAEDVSGIFSNIQHPCSDCRGFLEKHLEQHTPVVVARHRLPCDLDPNADYLMADGSPADPAIFTAGDLLYERWTFGRIMQYHNFKTGRRK
ncbi:MAG TPA: hypothetical protein VG102_01150 [Candidatus Paceibacterota bacterium]|jgi:hypothetical protein|nr:hypothetical protein [Candidatus Paceibacterota bacterium]